VSLSKIIFTISISQNYLNHRIP